MRSKLLKAKTNIGAGASFPYSNHLMTHYYNKLTGSELKIDPPHWTFSVAWILLAVWSLRHQFLSTKDKK